MVQVVGSKPILSPSSPAGAKLDGKAKPDFMASLQDQFAKVRDSMHELPGLPGVFSANPQTLATLNVGMVSPEAGANLLV